MLNLRFLVTITHHSSELESPLLLALFFYLLYFGDLLDNFTFEKTDTCC
jgi:hypothetical protein